MQREATGEFKTEMGRPCFIIFLFKLHLGSCLEGGLKGKSERRSVRMQ